MSLANPRRRAPPTRPDDNDEPGLTLQTSTALRKGATFHSPDSTASGASADAFVPPQLPRSPTNVDDIVDANCRRVALTIDGITETLAGVQLSAPSPTTPKTSLRDTSSPVPRGLLGLDGPEQYMAARPAVEDNVSDSRGARLGNHHDSDSGLGSSIASGDDKTPAVNKDVKANSSSPALTGTGAAAARDKFRALSPRAYRRIHEHILTPLLGHPTFKEFRQLVLDVPRRIRAKDIVCLRDLEKTLIFMAPVSRHQPPPTAMFTHTFAAVKTKDPSLYLDFCFSSIYCIQTTVELFSDREQIRHNDRPYTNGYFIDLKDQLLQYGRQLYAAKNKSDTSEDDDMNQCVYSASSAGLGASLTPSVRADEIMLYGGVAVNGQPAQLVRMKRDGTAISLATGQPVDMADAGSGPFRVKRSASEQLEDDEEIMRSMARRKKNASPEELSPKACTHPGCNKMFKRPCDLTKHEKTHTRPWKCPHVTCRYHELGWPTEKEMDRHINDKHSNDPAMYYCMYPPCVYMSKRESNCKQHMEKAHGYDYVRTKNNGRKPSTAENRSTPSLRNSLTPSSTTPSYGVPTPPQVPAHDFPAMVDGEWLGGANPAQPGDAEPAPASMTMDFHSPESAASPYEQLVPYQNGSTFIIPSEEDIYAAQARGADMALFPPEMQHMALDQKLLPQGMPIYQAQHMPLMAPVPHQQHPQHQQPSAVPAHFSPSAQQNAMLWDPSVGDDCASGSADFTLFSGPSTKGMHWAVQQPLFGGTQGGLPSAGLGFSQESQGDMLNQIPWSQLDSMGFDA